MPVRLPLFLLASLTAQAAVDFPHAVAPLLKKHCAECHTADKKKGGLSMNTRQSLLAGGENGPVVTPGQSAGSRLLEAVATQDQDLRMPPKGDGLSAAEVGLLKAWIDEGLAWPEDFAFQKPAYEPPLAPRRPDLPPAADGRTHPVDRLLDAWLAQRKLPRPAPLDDAGFARRVHLDLVGLLPEPEALQRFLRDPAPDKRAQLVRRLLDDDVAYAEHWLSFWNDLLRNDYGGTGFITGGRRQISGWLYDALVTNKPADQFTRELIAPAGDGSRGFIDGIRWRGEVSAGQTVEIQFAQSVGQSFLGINLKCASCHDSFVDRWKLDEAYGLAAIYATRPLEIARCDKATGRMAKASWLFPEIGQVDAAAPQPERLRQLAALMTHPQNGRFTRTLANRLWQRLMGRGIVHPVDAMQTEPWNADLLDYLASALADRRYDLKQLLELIATSQAYQSRSEVVAEGRDDHGYTYAGPRAKRLTAEQFVDAVWQLTSTAPAKIDAPVLRGKPDPQAARAVRIRGQWIWGASAGQGSPPAGEAVVLRKTVTLPDDVASAAAVITCDNSHELYVNGRLVSQSGDWQQLEAVPLQTHLKKGANTLVVIARNAGSAPNPAGLFFEARIRHNDGREESVASDASWEWHAQVPAGREGRLGALSAKGWQPAVPVQPVAVWQATLQRQAPPLLAQAARGTPRMVRASLLKSDLLMRSLGRPNRDQIVSTRPGELTTLEAIDLANNAQFADTLARGAGNLLKRPWTDHDALLRWLYQTALCREPTPAELAAARDSLGTQVTAESIADALWAVLMLPEFLSVR